MSKKLLLLRHLDCNGLDPRNGLVAGTEVVVALGIDMVASVF